MAEEEDAPLMAEVMELVSLRKISHKKEARMVAKLEQLVDTRKQQVEELQLQLNLLNEHREKLLEAFSLPTFPAGYKSELVAGCPMQGKDSETSLSINDKQANESPSQLENGRLQLARLQKDNFTALSRSEGNECGLGKRRKKHRHSNLSDHPVSPLGPATDILCPETMIVNERAENCKKIDRDCINSSEQFSELVKNTTCLDSGCPISGSSGSDSEGVSPKVTAKGLKSAPLQRELIIPMPVQELTSSQSKVKPAGSFLPKVKPGQCFDQTVLSLQGILDEQQKLETSVFPEDELAVEFPSCKVYEATLQSLIIKECKAMMSCWQKVRDQIKLEFLQKLDMQQSALGPTNYSVDGLVLWELRHLESKGMFREVEARHVLGYPQRFSKNDLVLLILPPLCRIWVAIVNHEKPLLILRMGGDSHFNIDKCFIRHLGNMKPLKRIYKAVSRVDTIVDPLKLQLLRPIGNCNVLTSGPNAFETEHKLSIKSKTLGPWLAASLFNSHQLRAIDALLQLSEGFMLVQGPPGTGKTYTICGMVSALLNERPSSKILICAPSNGALDEIAVRLSNMMFDGEGKPYSLETGDIVRLGKGTNIRNACRSFTVDALVSQNHQHFLEQNVVLRAKIIFATLNGCGHYLLKGLEGSFDLVIVDEAVQAVEAEALIALRKAKKLCVLVGDPYQLPAYVLQQPGCAYRRSLFERLQGAGVPVHVLEMQYRMHPAISSYPSRRFYKGRLLNSSPNVALETMFKPEACEQGITCHSCKFKLGTYYFLDVEHGFDFKENVRNSRYNNEEAFAVCSVVQGVMDNLKPEVHLDIGVITPYFEQQRLIKSHLSKSKVNSSFIEVNTVDGFQGREMDIIILSCVRAVPGEGLGFFSDERRINVALTRAKHVLLILGHAGTLRKESIFWKLLIDDARSRDSYQILDFSKRKGTNASTSCKMESEPIFRGQQNRACHLQQSNTPHFSRSENSQKCSSKTPTAYSSSKAQFESRPFQNTRNASEQVRISFHAERPLYMDEIWLPQKYQPHVQNSSEKGWLEHPRKLAFPDSHGRHGRRGRGRFIQH